MNSEGWDLAGLTDRYSRLGRPVPGALITVPLWLDLTPDRREIVWGGGPKDAKKRVWQAKLEPEMLNQFVHLWQETPESIFQFARKWGVLNLDQKGRPCRPIGPAERKESIDAWRYYSRRAQAVLNIAASLKLGNIGAAKDWEALRGTSSRTGDLLQELDRVEPFLLTMLPRVEYPFGGATVDPRYKRTVKSEKAFLSVEATLWLRLGRVGFTVAPSDSGWTLVIDYNGCMLAAVALQLALVLADVDALYQCSGCHEPYVRAKRAPRPGEANFCEKCGREKALQKADEKRRMKIKKARRLAEEGVSPPDIAQQLDSRPATVCGWIGKPEQIRKRPVRRRMRPSEPH